MKYLYKQLGNELLHNKIYLFFIGVLSFFTSFMYYFVHYSVDGNLEDLEVISVYKENQVMFYQALVSNRILARNILAAFICLTGFVIVMFFGRFFRMNKISLGCLKSLGFRDRVIRRFFVSVMVVLALVGGILALAVSWFASDILLNAYIESYALTEVRKGMGLLTFFTGLLLPMAIFGILAYAAYGIIERTEIGFLISGVRAEEGNTGLLRLADKISGVFPEKQKIPVRIALRNPAAAVLVLISVMSLSVMFILAYSLNLSSREVYLSQTYKHDYLYDVRFESPVVENMEVRNVDYENEIKYLERDGGIRADNNMIEQKVVGFEANSRIFQLTESMDREISEIKTGEVVIGRKLKELYGIKTGDKVVVFAGAAEREMKVADIAFNGESDCIYIEKRELEEMMGTETGAFSGIWCMEYRGLDDRFMEFGGMESNGMVSSSMEFNGMEFSGTVDNSIGNEVITREMRLEELERDMVSNRVSAVINQVMGCLIGAVMLYLALLLNFHDNQEDMGILKQLGYTGKEIKRMLIDIYKPVLLISFLLTLAPSIMLVRKILRSLSLQIGDYMPFKTNSVVILGVFVCLYGIYYIVLLTFRSCMRKL